MNQILSTNQGQPQQVNREVKKQIQYTPMPNLNSIKRANSTSTKADLAKVVRIFCIIIIIFGLVLIGQSTYAMISNREKDKDTISVSEDRMGKETKITVETNYPIKSFTYKWNDGEPVVVEGNGTIKFETIIQIPNGNNILNMTVKDYYGYEHKLHNKQYIYESTDVEMSYITYQWNEEEEVRIDVDKNDKQKISTDVEVPEGQNKLTIVAADKEGNRATRTENIVGDTKPTFTASLDGNKLIIVASDDESISKISVTVDGVVTDSGDQPINQKEITASMTLTSGGHTIEVSVTNINGLTATEVYTCQI